jgi:AcrR family transcriptional regulator
VNRSSFERTDFLNAARRLASDRGPMSVTVESVIERLKAPKGSFYYRFPSRNVLLGELWLSTILKYQADFLAAIENGDGLPAALHTPRWVRQNLDDARILLLYNRADFAEDGWPESLRSGVREQAGRLKAAFKRFAQEKFGCDDRIHIRKTVFVLADVPIAAVKEHIRRRENPPPVIDELIRMTYAAILHEHAAGDPK